MLKLAGLILLVALVLLGALLPLRYTARLQLPRRPPDGGHGDRARAAAGEPGDRAD